MSTSAWTPRHRALPQRADRRCGMTVMRRWWVRVWMPCQTGIWRRNRHPTIRSTSASVGDGTARRFCSPSGWACARYGSKVILRPAALHPKGLAVHSPCFGDVLSCPKHAILRRMRLNFYLLSVLSVLLYPSPAPAPLVAGQKTRGKDFESALRILARARGRGEGALN